MNRLPLAIVMLSMVASTSEAQMGGCRAPDQHAETLRYYVGQLVSGTTAPSARVRRVTGLTPMDSAAVVIETDSLACVRATQAVDSAMRFPPQTRTLIVVRAGNRYVVYDPSFKSGRAPSDFIFIVDSTFTYRIMLRQ